MRKITVFDFCSQIGAAGDRLVEIVAVDIVDVSGNTT